jgi:tetratricopeptide (TPR) repeat protein
MTRKTVGPFPRALAKARYFPLIFLLLFSRAGSSPREAAGPLFQAAKGNALSQEMQEAKAELQAGVNTWSLELFHAARDRFINCLMKAKTENAYILYHIALADYRLVTFYLSSKGNEDAEKSLQEAQKYLEKAMAVDPSFGEAFALYAFLLGFEIGLHPEKTITLGMASFDYSARALEKDPENPRIHLLKGISLFYTPEAYGGGVDNAIDSLRRAAILFEKEIVSDPFKPSWGKEEAYAYLGISYKQKKDFEKAKELLQKALEINPEFGLAKRELTGLEKNSPF